MQDTSSLRPEHPFLPERPERVEYCRIRVRSLTPGWTPHWLFAWGIAVALLSACGGGGGGGGTAPVPPVFGSIGSASCDANAQKQFVRDVAQDWYLWFDEMAAVSPDSFATAEEYLEALTAPLAEDFRDPGFSYLTTVAEDEANFTSGAFVGFGFRFAIDDTGRYFISDSFEDAPAFEAGFRRGAELLAVDSGSGYITMQEYENQGTPLASVFGDAEEGLQRGFRLRIDDTTRDVLVSKRELDVPPLADAPRLLERLGLSPVAYLHLRSFTRSAEPELDAAFATFADQGVTDVIVDLRYNSGGLVAVANRLLDLLGGEIGAGEVAYRIQHNSKRQSENRNYEFARRASTTAPIRIVFLTGEATASASELLINSIEPFADVALIGSDTSGKAVGQYAFDQDGCDTRLRLVAFETVNGEGFGGFYTGLVDTGRFTLCSVEDEFTGSFGSNTESLTAGALGWLNEGACPLSANSVSQRGLRRGDSPLLPQNRPDRRSLWVQ
ncbi:MAG: S41 family peptidase [Pseudomonadota bacterium]